MDSQDTNFRAIVAGAGKRLKLSSLLFGLYWWLAACLGLWLGLFIFDNLLNLPAGLRLPLAVGGAAFSVLGFFRRVCLPAAQKQTLERTAIMLEQRYGVPDNLLINALQFQEQKLRPEEQTFARHTITDSTRFVSRIRLGDLWDWNRLGLWGAAALGVLVLWGFYVFFFPRQFTSVTARYLRPLGDVPPASGLVLKLTPASDVTIAEGENLEVGLEIGAQHGRTPTKPPVIAWQEKADFVQPISPGGEQAAMSPKQNSLSTYLHTFANVQIPFAFRVFAGDDFTKSIQVKVRPRPRIIDSLYRLTPPAYTGLRVQTSPGPPAPIAGLPGSTVEILLNVEPALKSLVWNETGRSMPFKLNGDRWTVFTAITNPGTYQVTTSGPSPDKPLLIAQGDIRRLTDNPPEIEFLTDDRNRFVQFGSAVKLELQARDDFGIQAITIEARPAEQERGGTVLKKWTYFGPPGNPGPLKESFSFEIDPREFSSGATYCLEAFARDYSPDGAPGRSRPILLRIKSPEELAVADDDPLAAAFASLKNAVARQEKAEHLAGNLKTYLAEAAQKKTVADHRQAARTQQQAANDSAKETLGLFRQKTEGKSYATALSPVVEKEMPDVLDALAKLKPDQGLALAPELAAIEKQQAQILIELLNLLGKLAEQSQQQDKLNVAAKEPAGTPTVRPEDKAKEALDELKHFTSEEQKLIDRSKTFADKLPQDLTVKEEELLGELTREEAKWSKFFEEKLTDFSKLPLQDFGDTSLAQEFNSVFQEIQQAEKALSEKKVELAVPHEQSGLENAKDLIHNLERWLADTPDHIKWNTEEPLMPADVAMAELPSELEDIVGDLIDKETEMTPAVEDVTSSWMDSPDKGAGWDAMDGPISSMSAKGVTGNLLPNQQEIGGRSGEGRSGRSHGQMVADTAEGKGGRETPTRLTPSPFEPGAVKDSSKEGLGGATGGGKLSGGGEEGLRGPTSTAANQRLPRLAERQAKIRQQAEELALRLRRIHVPTGDLEVSINAMSRFEESARKNDGLNVRRAFSRALDALGEAKKVTKTEIGLQQEKVKLPTWMREEIRLGIQDGIPKGYEEMAGEYFRALAEGKTK
jgi:hypothetical protein